MRKYYQGKYEPKNPKKFVNPKGIVYRSGLEFKAMRYLEDHSGVILIASEELAVEYYNPAKGDLARYFPDLIVKMKDKDGKIKTVMVEIKPKSQSKPPKKNKKNFLYEQVTWEVNQAKWNAAKAYCKKNGWEFMVITEDDIGVDYK